MPETVKANAAQSMTAMIAEACLKRLSPAERARVILRFNRGPVPAQPLLRSRRQAHQAAERAIEALLDYVDEDDGDADLEEEPDREEGGDLEAETGA